MKKSFVFFFALFSVFVYFIPNRAAAFWFWHTPVKAQSGTMQQQVEIPLVSHFSLEWAFVGEPGNKPDLSNGLGEVDYPFWIGSRKVMAWQYATFLNAVAWMDDPYELYSTRMENQENIQEHVACISRRGVKGSYRYKVLGDREDPVNNISFLDAARFCNWLENHQPVGQEDLSTTEEGTYSLNGCMVLMQGLPKDSIGIPRNPEAHYFIPDEEEWYKAAYYCGGGEYNQLPGDQETILAGDFCLSHVKHQHIGYLWEWNDTSFASAGEFQPLNYLVQGGENNNIKLESERGKMPKPGDLKVPDVSFRVMTLNPQW